MNFLSPGVIEGGGACQLTCLLAGMPTSLCPSSVKATVEGVVLIPKAQSGGRSLTLSVLNDSGVV